MSGTSTPHQNTQHERNKLDRAFIGGVAWTAGAKWLSQLVSWPSLLIVARFLSPADFGIVEMAGFYFIVTNVMAEFGIGTAVLQMQELERSIVAQINTIAMLSGVAAFGVSVLAAPLLADFFRVPALTHVVVITSVTFLLTAFQAVPLALLQRDMDYRRLSVQESVQALVTAVTSVGCAYAGLGYWSLIAGNLGGRASAIALTNFWRPVPFAVPRWKQVKTPLRFGMEIAAQRISWSVYLMSDGIVIGRTLGQSLLGTYRMAINIASAPAEKIGMLIMRVTGPLFARVQTDIHLTRRYFLILSEVMITAILPLVMGLVVVAPEAIHLLLGPKWAGAAAPLRWLAIFTVIRTLNSLAGQVLTSLRFTKFSMWMSFLGTAVMPVSFYVASRWGIGAVAAAWVVMSPVTFFPTMAKLFREIDCSLLEYLKSLQPALIGSAVMVTAVWGVQQIAPGHWPAWGRLGVEVLTGGVAYGGVIWGVYRKRVMHYVEFFKRLRQSPDAMAVEAA